MNSLNYTAYMFVDTEEEEMIMQTANASTVFSFAPSDSLNVIKDEQSYNIINSSDGWKGTAVDWSPLPVYETVGFDLSGIPFSSYVYDEAKRTYTLTIDSNDGLVFYAEDGAILSMTIYVEGEVFLSAEFGKTVIEIPEFTVVD